MVLVDKIFQTSPLTSPPPSLMGLLQYLNDHILRFEKVFR
jgi:hypothetical protein